MRKKAPPTVHANREVSDSVYRTVVQTIKQIVLMRALDANHF